MMTNDAETTATFRPKFDEKGLVTAVVTDCDSGALLMVAHMNAAAIAASQATGMAHFWSRSRGALWKKGETSGNILKICEMRVDCDQDCLWLIVEPAGPACHTGAVSCFYRKVNSDASLDAASGANPDSTS